MCVCVCVCVFAYAVVMAMVVVCECVCVCVCAYVRGGDTAVDIGQVAFYLGYTFLFDLKVISGMFARAWWGVCSGVACVWV